MRRSDVARANFAMVDASLLLRCGHARNRLGLQQLPVLLLKILAEKESLNTKLSELKEERTMKQTRVSDAKLYLLKAQQATEKMTALRLAMASFIFGSTQKFAG